VARASQGDRCTGEHVNPTVVTKPDRRKRVPRVMAIANSRRGSRPENSCGMLCADRSRATPRANLARPEKACARNSASSTRDPNSDMAERQTSGPFQGNGAVTVRTRARTLFSLSTIADLCARERWIGPTTKAAISWHGDARGAPGLLPNTCARISALDAVTVPQRNEPRPGAT